MPVPEGTIPQSKRPVIAENAMNWLRNNSPKPEDIDQPTVLELAKLAKVPIPNRELGPKEKKKILELTNVPRPGIDVEDLENLPVQCERLAEFPGILLQKEIGIHL